MLRSSLIWPITSNRPNLLDAVFNRQLTLLPVRMPRLHLYHFILSNLVTSLTNLFILHAGQLSFSPANSVEQRTSTHLPAPMASGLSKRGPWGSTHSIPLFAISFSKFFTLNPPPLFFIFVFMFLVFIFFAVASTVESEKPSHDPYWQSSQSLLHGSNG